MVKGEKAPHLHCGVDAAAWVQRSRFHIRMAVIPAEDHGTDMGLFFQETRSRPRPSSFVSGMRDPPSTRRRLVPQQAQPSRAGGPAEEEGTAEGVRNPQ